MRKKSKLIQETNVPDSLSPVCTVSNSNSAPSVVADDQAVPEGIVSEWGKQNGQGDWVDYGSRQNSAWSELANPTGMIEFNNNNQNWTSLCTGFLYDPTSLLTAGHCDQLEICRKNYEEYGADRYRLRFGYQLSSVGKTYGVKEITGPYHCEGTNEQYDFSVFKLKSSAAASKFGTVELQETYQQGQKIAITHHPNGAPKKISQGTLTQYYENFGLFGHTADTLGGSSGAPVASANSKRVVGIHVQGGVDENYAVPVSSALNF